MHEESLAQFLQGAGPDSQGRMYADILNFSDEELEEVHDYIQWLFPLREPSMAVPGSPVVESDDMAELLRNDTDVRANTLLALERMKRFYADNDHWLAQGDHNHLRITRILKSACLLGLRDEAIKFHNFILQRVESAQPVTRESLAYWQTSISLATPASLVIPSGSYTSSYPRNLSIPPSKNVP